MIQNIQNIKKVTTGVSQKRDVYVVDQRDAPNRVAQQSWEEIGIVNKT